MLLQQLSQLRLSSEQCFFFMVHTWHFFLMTGRASGEFPLNLAFFFNLAKNFQSGENFSTWRKNWTWRCFSHLRVVKIKGKSKGNDLKQTKNRACGGLKHPNNCFSSLFWCKNRNLSNFCLKSPRSGELFLGHFSSRSGENFWDAF